MAYFFLKMEAGNSENPIHRLYCHNNIKYSIAHLRKKQPPGVGMDEITPMESGGMKMAAMWVGLGKFTFAHRFYSHAGFAETPPKTSN